jgi:hypothetical protein
MTDRTGGYPGNVNMVIIHNETAFITTALFRVVTGKDLQVYLLPATMMTAERYYFSSGVQENQPSWQKLMWITF